LGYLRLKAASEDVYAATGNLNRKTLQELKLVSIAGEKDETHTKISSLHNIRNNINLRACVRKL
jgi:hypothetical protein